MKTLLPVLLLSMLFAHLAERASPAKEEGQLIRRAPRNIWFYLLLLTLILPVGLREHYNDTMAYVRSYLVQPSLPALLASGELHLLRNPGFEIYTSLLRSMTDNYHIFLMLGAIFVETAFVVSIWRYSDSFTFSIGVFVLLGTYVFTMAAMKQTIAMGILLLSLPYLTKRSYLKYYLLVFAAFLFHTYAVMFAILPLFCRRPWRLRTFLLVGLTLFVMYNFDTVIGSVVDYATESGKTIAEYEVFDNRQVNIFRVLVYAVVPALSLLLSGYLYRDSGEERSNYLIIHMSIISFGFMLLGTINGANMFARMAMYFEFGIICGLPWIIDKAFVRGSAQVVKALALVCFAGFFVYANAIAADFSQLYQATTLLDFIGSLFS